MIDIVIVNYNSTDFLIECLASVHKALKGRPAKIYVQDNASKDRPERIRTLFPDVILNINPRNLGFAKAVNQALRQGHGEYVVLLNPDTHVTENFFQTSLDYMEKIPMLEYWAPEFWTMTECCRIQPVLFPHL